MHPAHEVLNIQHEETKATPETQPPNRQMLFDQTQIQEDESVAEIMAEFRVNELQRLLDDSEKMELLRLKKPTRQIESAAMQACLRATQALLFSINFEKQHVLFRPAQEPHDCPGPMREAASNLLRHLKGYHKSLSKHSAFVAAHIHSPGQKGMDANKHLDTICQFNCAITPFTEEPELKEGQKYVDIVEQIRGL